MIWRHTNKPVNIGEIYSTRLNSYFINPSSSSIRMPQAAKKFIKLHEEA